MSAPDPRDIVITDLTDENAGLRAELDAARDHLATYRTMAQAALTAVHDLTVERNRLRERCRDQQRQIADLLEIVREVEAA